MFFTCHEQMLQLQCSFKHLHYSQTHVQQQLFTVWCPNPEEVQSMYVQTVSGMKQESCDVRDNMSTSSPLLPSWISCLPRRGTAPLHRSTTALWWPPHHCHLCEPCSAAPACTTYFQSGYHQRNQQAMPYFNFVLEMAVKRQRTVKATCVKAQVYERGAGHHVEQHRDG